MPTNRKTPNAASSSGDELIPIIKKKNQLLVDAQLLHNILGVKTKLSTWLERRISELKLEENLDFFPNLGRNNKKQYAFSIRIAQFISLFEGNEVSRQIRQQLMRQETSMIFLDTGRLKQLDYYERNGQRMYRYAAVLKELGYQKSGSAYRTRLRYPNDFYEEVDAQGTVIILVSEQYATVMSHRRIARNLLQEVKTRQLQLPFNTEVGHD